MKLKYIFVCIAIFSIYITGCSLKSEVEPNGQVAYNHLTLDLDETNLYEYAGTMDYIFIGTVEEIVDDIVNSDFPNRIYRIKVNENLKGKLVTTVEVKKQGGYNNEGTLILNETDQSKDNGLPQVNKQYIFMTYSQVDGSLLLAEINGNIELTDELMKKEYQDYIKNEIEDSRKRFISKYDQNST
ncbi:hypothetical protein WAK64_02645 [Bacillus spongiae]|uniref:Uncharacterized protein n=1 Tax=Bacillus spongiae TaxID=2683610 RepID=A0ABU8H9S1_9BACI